MLYQIGLILILVVIALVMAKKLKKTEPNQEQLIYEDDMSDDELKELDDEIH